MKAALAMLQACGLQAVPIGRPDGPEMPAALSNPLPLLVSMAVDDSDEEKSDPADPSQPPSISPEEFERVILGSSEFALVVERSIFPPEFDDL